MRGGYVPFAVGTTIADRPAHRSVRAELPHTAPTSDEWRQGAPWRTPLDPWALVPRSVSGACRVLRRSPWPAPFPPHPPPRRLPLCSAASSVLWRSQPPPRRTRPACGYSPSRTGLLPQTPRRSTGSRAYCFSACLGSSTTPGPAMARELSPSAGVAFPLTEKSRRPVLSFRSSIAQPTDASVYASPAASRRPVQDSRSGWSRFSFPVGLFHPLQHAGLSRRTPSPCFPPVPLFPRGNPGTDGGNPGGGGETRGKPGGNPGKPGDGGNPGTDGGKPGDGRDDAEQWRRSVSVNALVGSVRPALVGWLPARKEWIVPGK